MNKMLLQGGGEHARVVVDCLKAQAVDIVAIFDPKFSGDLFGVPYRGVYDPQFETDAHAVIAIGDNKTRKKVAEKTSHDFGTVIHPSAVLSQFSVVGKGCMLMHGSIIQANTKIGNHVIINTGACIDHDCNLADFVHIGPGAVLCGTVSVGEGSFIGAGCVIIPGKKVGAWAIVGAGSVVVNDIPDYAVAVGNPARVIKFNYS